MHWETLSFASQGLLCLPRTDILQGVTFDDTLASLRQTPKGVQGMMHFICAMKRRDQELFMELMTFVSELSLEHLQRVIVCSVRTLSALHFCYRRGKVAARNLQSIYISLTAPQGESRGRQVTAIHIQGIINFFKASFRFAYVEGGAVWKTVTDPSRLRETMQGVLEILIQLWRHIIDVLKSSGNPNGALQGADNTTSVMVEKEVPLRFQHRLLAYYISIFISLFAVAISYLL